MFAKGIDVTVHGTVLNHEIWHLPNDGFNQLLADGRDCVGLANEFFRLVFASNPVLFFLPR